MLKIMVFETVNDFDFVDVGAKTNKDSLKTVSNLFVIAGTKISCNSRNTY